MDISAIGMGVAFLAAIGIPIYLMMSKRKNKNKNTKKELLTYAENHGLTLSEIEITSRLALGFDAQKQEIVFAPIEHIASQCKQFNLSDLTSSQLVAPETPQNGISRIAIKLKGNIPAEEMVFYDYEEDMGADAVLCKSIAQKWTGLMSQKMAA